MEQEFKQHWIRHRVHIISLGTYQFLGYLQFIIAFCSLVSYFCLQSVKTHCIIPATKKDSVSHPKLRSKIARHLEFWLEAEFNCLNENELTRFVLSSVANDPAFKPPHITQRTLLAHIE
jgi:hypothetical protein